MLRTPLGPRSGNIRRGPELTPYARGKIVGAAQSGKTHTQIAITQKWARSTVQSTLSLDLYRNEGESQPRSGRPKTYTEREERSILRQVRLHPKCTYADVRRACLIKLCDSTLKRILKKHGITNWRAKQRPALTEEHAAKRLAWCIERIHWSVEEWRKYMWSDECSVERGSGGNREWVFRTPVQKWQKEMIQIYKKGKDISIMVWGCFWGDGRCDLYILDRDFESKKHGYSANSYIEVLDAEVAGHHREGLIFMQDNASIHTAHKVRAWFAEQRIPVADWPPYSPDLNPIEHLWPHLKRKVLEMHPELETITGEDNIREAIGTALQEAWSLIGKDLMDSLIESMPDRVKACKKAGGWHTKY
jgi:transposase